MQGATGEYVAELRQRRSNAVSCPLSFRPLPGRDPFDLPLRFYEATVASNYSWPLRASTQIKWLYVQVGPGLGTGTPS
jgi:hypothetical protein